MERGIQYEYILELKDFSLKIVVPKFEELLGIKVNFVNNCVGSQAAEAVNAGNVKSIY